MSTRFSLSPGNSGSRSGALETAPTGSLVVICPKADDTRSLAAFLARQLPAGTLITLSGQLGAGKTTFTQGLGIGLGITEPIVSPTFVLVREYPVPPMSSGLEHRRPSLLIHADFYRLGGDADAYDLGIDDYLDGDGIVVIEWPERAPLATAADALHVDLAAETDTAGLGEAADESTDVESPRRVTIRASGPRSAAVLDALRSGWPAR